MVNQTSYKFMVYRRHRIHIFVMSFVPFISILCISIRLLLRDRNIYSNNNNATRIDPSQFYSMVSVLSPN